MSQRGNGDGDDDALAQRLEALRRSFDEGFARPLEPQRRERREAWLGLRAGERALAVAVTALAGVVRRPALTFVRGASPALLGLAAVEGRLVGVYSLARLLDPASPKSPNPGPWLATCRADPTVGLVFDSIDGAVEPEGPAPAGEVVRFGDTLRLVLELDALREQLTRQLPPLR